MFHKTAPFSILLMLVLSTALAACSGNPLANLPIMPQTQANDPAKMAVTSKLAVGILKMEGTSQAVTSTQACALLPLWRAVYKMGNDQSASSTEVTALYEQIQETLTADQVNAIQKINWTQQELMELTQKYGGGNPSGQSASSSAAAKSSSSQQGGPGGGPPDMGGPGGGPMGDILGPSGGTTSSTATAKSGSTSARGAPSSDGNLNPMLASAVINVLKTRVTME